MTLQGGAVLEPAETTAANPDQSHAGLAGAYRYSEAKPLAKLSSVSVVLPAYNEEENIANTVAKALAAFEKYFDEVCIIPVEDGGSDNTRVILKDLEKNDARVKAVFHAHNKGYGGALRSGFDAAKTEYVFFSDSDGQFDFEEIDRLIPFIRTYDMVLGFRLHRADPFHRKLNAWAWGSLVKLLFGLKAKDIDCAFKLFRRKVLQEVVLTANGAMINTELLARAKKGGFNLINVPVSHYPRTLGEQTGANPLVVLKAFLELFRLFAKLA